MHLLFDAYKHDKSLETSVYTDVWNAFKKWTGQNNIKLYLCSNGWAYAMKVFLKKTNHDDMTKYITDYFDTSMGSLTDQGIFKTIQDKIGFPGEDILFLTHWGDEGIVAHQSGLSVVVVATHRTDVKRERTEEVRQNELPFVRTFNDLSFGNNAPPASSMFDSTGIDVSKMSSAVGSSSMASSAYSGNSKGSSSASRPSSAKSGSSSKGSSSSFSGSHSKGSSAASGSNSKGSSAASGSTSKGSSSASGSTSKGSSSAASSSKSKPSSGASSH